MFVQKVAVKGNPKQAVVVALDGRAVLRSHLTKREEPLNVGKPLFMGDAVRSVDGVLTLSEYGKTVRIKPSPTWHTIYPPPNPAYQKFVVPIMGRLGVPTDGDANLVFESPLPSGNVLPDRFRLRWRPGDAQKMAGRPIQVRVRMGTAQIWPSPNTVAVLPPNQTEWSPPELQALLVQLQKENKLADFELQWTNEARFSRSFDLPSGKPPPFNGATAFSLLPLDKQKELDAALDGIRKNFDPMEQALYRIAWFDNNHLFSDAADAYEAAARLAPSRLDLKEAALEFLRAHGLETRARQLERDLFR